MVNITKQGDNKVGLMYDNWLENKDWSTNATKATLLSEAAVILKTLFSVNNKTRFGYPHEIQNIYNCSKSFSHIPIQKIMSKTRNNIEFPTIKWNYEIQ